MMQRPPALDTIAAISTPPGQGGIGVVRVSGPGTEQIAKGIIGKLPAPRQATFCDFLDAGGLLLDRGIALYFKQPHSFTGENVLELQGHGGTAVMQTLLARCLELGARLAQPGEFSQRAFLNGKIDLAQAEGIADLISASSTQAVRCALRSLQGEFSRAIHGVVAQLMELRTYTEATLDFPEEEIDPRDRIDLQPKLMQIIYDLQAILQQAKQGSILREGARIALIGRPNVGKSSLLNSLSGEDVALVSEIAGTTRDVIQQAINIEGIPLHIVDTAGLRETEDIVERMGVERTRQTIQKADLVLLLIEAHESVDDGYLQEIRRLSLGAPLVLVANKIDLYDLPPAVLQEAEVAKVFVSAKTGSGLDLLKKQILKTIGWHPESGLYMARARHLSALEKAMQHLEKAKGGSFSLELLAEELRQAQKQLGSITGEVTPDDLLGEIFSRFCIGK